MYSNWNYLLRGNICMIKKANNDITIFCIKSEKNWCMMKLIKFLILTIFSLLYTLQLQNYIAYILNNHQVINKNEMSYNILCSYISSVWEQYSKILNNMHFDHVI